MTEKGAQDVHRTGWTSCARGVFLLLAGCCCAYAGEPQQLSTIVVNGTPLPVPGLGVPLAQVPASVQTLGSDEIGSRPDATLPQLLQRDLGSVDINDAQNNPFQPDLSFRGFDASPLLGTPEALSIYVDGVRVNEPFGDVVNFDLIPLPAIARVTLMSGSNPVYGLNTLGGALSFQTKSGFDFPGFAASAYGGSFGTRSATVEQGGHGQHFGWYLAGNDYASDGWAAHNPGRVRQVFAKGSYRDAANTLDLSFTGAGNHLEGNQTLPLSFLDAPDQSYTFPDWFDNRFAFLVLDGSHRFSDEWTIAGNLYNRVLDTHGLDTNVSDDFDFTRPVTPDNPPGINEFGRTHEHARGGTLQFVGTRALFGHDNHFVLGASADFGDTLFAQDQQPAYFSDARESIGFAPGLPHTRLAARNRYLGAYLTDTFSLTQQLTLTLAGRYNHALIELDDRLGTALNGRHAYSRFNPAIGLTWNPTDSLTTWIGYNEGTRVPSPSELTCADPAAPCSLPNAFLSDPALAQVVAKTWEAGARGRLDQKWKWNASLFRTDLDNDLLFISLSGLKGFYQNVPGDRRQGFELGMDGALGRLHIGANYAFTDATYLSAFTESSPDNSSADAAGLITVQTGDRIPDIARQNFKLALDYAFNPQFKLGAQWIVVSRRYAHGDENNADVHGALPGYGVVNLDAHWYPSLAWDVFAGVDNLFDHRYATFGQLGENVFADPARIFEPADAQATQFRGVAAPRALQIGFRYRLD